MPLFYRCGIDTRVRNNDGKTAEDVLVQDRPEGWEEMLHWYKKYKPGTVYTHLRTGTCPPLTSYMHLYPFVVFFIGQSFGQQNTNLPRGSCTHILNFLAELMSVYRLEQKTFHYSRAPLWRRVYTSNNAELCGSVCERVSHTLTLWTR